MTVFSHGWGRVVRWVRSGPALATVAGERRWTVATPVDPTQPLWLVPAYQRRQRSGDRLVQR